jgi:hypothetical protein
MRKPVLALVTLLPMLCAIFMAPAHAQNVRSWVASDGGGSICSRAAPCATFAVAYGRTNAGGEINCVDQGDFGPLFIFTPVTVDCTGVQGRVGVAGAGNEGIRVQVPSGSDTVVLRGLDIDGAGTAATGIVFVGGGALHIEKCVIHDFVGFGINAAPNINPITELFVSDTIVMNSGTIPLGAGIIVDPVGIPNSITRVILNRVEARNNNFGIKADGTNASGGVINMTVRDSVSSGNRSNGIVGTGNANGPAVVMKIDHSTSSHNATAGYGIIADGPKTIIVLDHATVSGNLNGIGVSNGGSLISYQNNDVSLNSIDGTPSSVLAFK